MFYKEDSYYVEKLHDNRQVQSYLKEIRKEKADYFVGVITSPSR